MTRDRAERGGSGTGRAARVWAAWIAGVLPWFLTVHAAPLISEFMASNLSLRLDEDGDPSDWIELHNPGPDGLSLLGWSLTDDATQPRKWQFPERYLEPGAYLVVFASGKDRSGAGNLHTNFRLEASGEYLGL